jgi:hypothetical protein
MIDVDSPWGNSDLKDGPILLKVFFAQIVKRGAKTAQRLQDGISVLRGRHDPNIDVHGGPGITVGCERIGTDKEEFNLPVGQGV